MINDELPGVEIPREFWPCPEGSGGSLPGFLSENPGRLWSLTSHPDWLFCLVIMPGPVGWACLMGPIPESAPPPFGPVYQDIWSEGFRWFRERNCPVVQFLGDLPGNFPSTTLHPTISFPKPFVPVTEFWDLRWKKKIAKCPGAPGFPLPHPVPPPRPEPPQQMENGFWTQSVAVECREIALRTMAGSLDCPELAAYRSDLCAWESLIQIHGPQKPCWILHWKNKPAGILLGHVPEPGFPDAQGEISYFGLAPEFRGNHLGGKMLAQFLAEKVPDGSSMVTMVDSRNSPACKTYQKVGFENFRTSCLFLAKL